MRQKGRQETQSEADAMPQPMKAAGRRSTFEIRMDILRAIMGGAEGSTQIMYKANLSWILLCDNLAALGDEGLIGERTIGNRKRYSLTNSGIEAVGVYLSLLRQILFDTPVQRLGQGTEETRIIKRARQGQGKLTVILQKEEEGYSVRSVELPGAISEGRTKKEALENIREAIQGYLEAFPEDESRLSVKNEIVQITT